MNILIKSLKLILFFTIAAAFNFSAEGIDSYEKWDPEIVKIFEAMPVQEEGRLKPMQTVARYKLMRINNSKRLRFEIGGEKIKVSAAEWLMDCLFRPELAKKMPIFKVNNPDVVEILRANYSILAGQASELENIISLPSGYHRDLQLTKRSLVSSFDISLKSLSILPKLIKSIKVNKKNSLEYIDNEMNMTDKVYALVNEGTPFRDAYNKVKNSDDLSKFSETASSNYSEGSPGNLRLNVLEKRLSKQR